MEVDAVSPHRDVDVDPELIADAVAGVDELRPGRDPDALRGAEAVTRDAGGINRGEVSRNRCIHVEIGSGGYPVRLLVALLWPWLTLTVQASPGSRERIQGLAHPAALSCQLDLSTCQNSLVGARA